MPSLKHFDRYIARKQRQRENDPFTARAKIDLSRLGSQNRIVSRELDRQLNRQGLPANVLVQATQEAQSSFNRSAANVLEDAALRDVQRADQITSEIDQLQFQRDLAKEQQEEQDRLGLKALPQLAGAAIGLAAGGLPGAQAGAGFGQIAGEFAFGGSPSPENLIQGFSSTIDAISTSTNLRRDRSFLETVRGAIPHLSNLGTNELTQFQLLLQTGDEEAITQFLNGLGSI